MIKCRNSWNIVIIACSMIILSLILFYIVSKQHDKILRSLPGQIYYADCDYMYKYDFKSTKRNQITRLYLENESYILERSKYSISRSADILCYVESKYTKRENGPNGNGLHRLFVVDNNSKKTLFQYTFSNNVFVYGVTLAPGADKLAVVYSACDKETLEPEDPCIDIININDGSIKRLPVKIGMYNSGISWSPTGDQIVFLDHYKTPVIFDLVSMKTKILQDRSGNAIWSPSGRFIIVGNSKLYDTVFEKYRTIKLPTEAIVAGWSPDSTVIIFEEPSDIGSYSVYVYSMIDRKILKLPIKTPGKVGLPVLWR